MPAQSVGVKGAESIRDLGHKFILQIKFQNKIKKVKFTMNLKFQNPITLLRQKIFYKFIYGSNKLMR